MKRIAWLTDIHLDFVTPDEVARFFDRVVRAEPDCVLIGGDISESQTLYQHLTKIDKALELPIYFVLGNHDFYHGSIRAVRIKMAQISGERPNLVYLSQSDVTELTPKVALVGHDGWADARVGDYEHSNVMLNDYLLIKELSLIDRMGRRSRLEALGDEAAAHIRHVLPKAMGLYPRVLLLTHVPPLRAACWHEGRISDDQWSPHFTCQALGEAVLEVASQFPDSQLTVLCGHTHSPGETKPLANVTILTGGAEYHRPEIQQVFEFE